MEPDGPTVEERLYALESRVATLAELAEDVAGALAGAHAAVIRLLHGVTDADRDALVEMAERDAQEITAAMVKAHRLLESLDG